MEKKLVQRLESVVAYLEVLSSGFTTRSLPKIGDDATLDPLILAFDDLLGQYLASVSAAAEKIGGQVIEVTKILQEAFTVHWELLVKVKKTQVCEASSFFFPISISAYQI